MTSSCSLATANSVSQSFLPPYLSKGLFSIHYKIQGGLSSCLSCLYSPFAEILENHHQLLWSGRVVMGCQVVEPLMLDEDPFICQLIESTCNPVARKLHRKHQTTQCLRGPLQVLPGSEEACALTFGLGKASKTRVTEFVRNGVCV